MLLLEGWLPLQLPERPRGCLSKAYLSILRACPSPHFQALVSEEVLLFLPPSCPGAGAQPSGPKSWVLIPRTLDTGTHCLKVLFVSPVGQPSVFDHFYNFVIMGCIRLGCLNVRVITFHCSYPNPSKRERWRRQNISRGGSLCPSLLLFPAGLGSRSHPRDEKQKALVALRIQESQFCAYWGNPQAHLLARLWTRRLSGVLLLFPWGSSHALVWRPLKIGHFFFFGWPPSQHVGS